MDAELRSLLESIAYGTDQRLTVTERLRAAELLAGAGQSEDLHAFDTHVAQMDTAQLDAELDGSLVVDVCRAILTGESSLGVSGADWPVTASYLAAEFERQVEARVAELVDIDKRQREIEQRATELAEIKYRQRDFGIVSPEPQEALSGDPEPGEPEGSPELPEAVSEPVDLIVAMRAEAERRWSDSPDDGPGIRRPPPRRR